MLHDSVSGSSQSLTDATEVCAKWSSVVARQMMRKLDGIRGHLTEMLLHIEKCNDHLYDLIRHAEEVYGYDSFETSGEMEVEQCQNKLQYTVRKKNVVQLLKAWKELE